MKNIIMLMSIMLLVFFLSACIKTGDTNNVILNIGESNIFSEEEINNAMTIVKKKFKSFKGGNLTELWYDEEKSNKFVEGYLSGGDGSVNGVGAGNLIVLLSNFEVDSSGIDGSFEPDSTYVNWNWILIRNSKRRNWKVKDWGY